MTESPAGQEVALRPFAAEYANIGGGLPGLGTDRAATLCVVYDGTGTPEHLALSGKHAVDVPRG